MKVLALYEYPPSPGGLATQGELLVRGLEAIGVDVFAVHPDADKEMEWYYRWFKPDVVVGVGYWGHTPQLVIHPLLHSVMPVPWLVADGYIAGYKDILNSLPCILATSSWVRDVYIRDGIIGDIIEVLPVGCDTDSFTPTPRKDPRVRVIREMLGVDNDELMILTVGGDAASKGAREVMQALAQLPADVPRWCYICKVWPQPRTEMQNQEDQLLIDELGLKGRVRYLSGRMSRRIMPYLFAACDIYAGPSRLEGFGMPHVEAGACGKPVLAIDAMAFRDTMVHRETAYLAKVAVQHSISQMVLPENAGEWGNQLVVFDTPRVVDYRADANDIALGLKGLLCDEKMRMRMGHAGRLRAVKHFDYRVVAKRFVDIVTRRLRGEKIPSLNGVDEQALARAGEW